MATTTSVQERAELNLKMIGLMLGDLPEIAAEWDQIGEGERVSWSMDWSNEMAGLKHLAQHASDGLLTPSQAARYEDLVCRLKQVIPTLEQLNLYRPPMLLDV